MIFWNIRKKLIFCFIAVIAIAGGVLFYFRYIKAASFSLYPGSCLGSWQNPYLAQGRPDVGDTFAINKENSAIFSEGGIKEIYCGSFNGDLSEGEIKLIKSVNLKFSWLVSDEELKVATSSITIIQPPATSSEAVVQNTNDVINQILNNIHADEVSVMVSTTTPEITITTNASISEPPPTHPYQGGETGEVNSSSVSEINTTKNTAAIATSSPTSFWWKKYNFFSADDQVSNTAVTTSDVVAITATSSLDSPIASTLDFLKVSYTLDGVNWQELGMVNKNNWQGLSFNIPVYQLEDVKKIQIKIESLPLLNKTPFVYLDGLALEVEYESEVLTQNVSLSSVSSTKPLKERNLQKNIVLDEKAAHSCRAEPFRLDISGKSYLTTTLILQNGGKQEPEEIKIGSLPIGIDVVFAKNKDYIYLSSAGEATLDLEIKSEPGSQKGSFSIPIIYTEKSTSDSTTICQINVINF